MKRLAAFAASVLLLLGQLPPPATGATNPPPSNQSPFLEFSSRTHSLPANAIPGSNAQRQSAYNTLTAQQQQAVNSRVTPYMTNAVQSAQQKYNASVQSQDPLLHTSGVDGRFARALSPLISQETGLAFLSDAGAQTTVPLYPNSVNTAKQQWPNVPGFHTARERRPGRLQLASYRVPDNGGSHGWRPLHASLAAPAAPQSGGTDLDHDGLPDAFESQVADAFTPYYHVSTGESDNFATFFDYVPETVNQRLGPHPLSYFRVKPLGFVYDGTGRQYGALQINYLTLWDHDSGLQIGGLCDTFLGIASGITGIGLANLVTVLSSHNLDDEHSAALVLAPTPSPYLYDTTVSDYHGYSYYTAAHEGTFFDESAYLNPYTPIQAGLHLQLWLSLAKHSSYTFNPNYMPLVPYWLIFAYYDELSVLYLNGIISDLEYFYLLYVGDTLFFACIVEHFGEQGGVFASPRIHVGEPVSGSTLNGSGFILDTNHVYPKLTELIWYVSNAPNFSLSVTPTQTVNPGQSTAYSVSASPQNGFNGTVTFSASGLPAGATASFSPPSVTAPGASTMSVTTTSATPTGTFVITVSGVTGSITNATTAQLIVAAPGPTAGTGTVAISGFEQTVTITYVCGPYGQTCQRTIPDSGTVSIAVNGYGVSTSYGQSSTAATLASALATALGSNNSNPISPVNATVSGSTVTLTAKATGAAGNYPLSASSSTNNSQYLSSPSFTATASGTTLKVPDFTLTASPASKTINPGQSATYSASVTAMNGFTSNVALSVSSGLPTGAAASFNPASVSGSGSSTLTVTTSASTPVGTYTLPIAASGGGITHTAAVTLTVVAGGTVPGTGTVTINGFEQTTTITYVCGPNGQTCQTTIPDSGSVSITVNGVTVSVSYGQGSTANSVASALSAALNSNTSSPVTATVSGSVVTLTAKTTGTASNYPLSASSATGNTQYFSSPSFTPVTSGTTLTGGH